MHRKDGLRHIEDNALGGTKSIHFLLGHLADAIRCQEMAYANYAATKERGGEGHSLLQLGNYQEEMGNADESIRYLTRARKIADEIGDRGLLARCLRSIASVYIGEGDLEAGLLVSNQALEISLSSGDRFGEAQDLVYLGNIELRNERIQAAINRYKHALTIAEQLGTSILIATCLNNLGYALYKQGQSKAALDKCQQALHLAQECGAGPLAVSIQESLDEIAKNLGNGIRARFWQRWVQSPRLR